MRKESFFSFFFKVFFLKDTRKGYQTSKNYEDKLSSEEETQNLVKRYEEGILNLEKLRG